MQKNSAAAAKRRRFWRRALPFLAGGSLIVASLLFCAALLLRRQPLLRVWLEDEPIGYAESNRPVLNAVGRLEREMADATGKRYLFDGKITFEPVTGSRRLLTPDGNWLPLLYDRVGGEWTDAILLSIDGVKIGAVRDEKVAETVFDVITAQKTALLPLHSGETFELRNAIRFDKTLVQHDYLLSAESLYLLLSEGVGEIAPERELLQGASLLPAAVAEEEPPQLQFLSLRFEIETVYEPFETDYLYSDGYYDGQEIVEEEGTVGVRTDRYLLQSLDGKLLSRDFVDSTYETERKNRVVTRGTKEKIADGEFIWPIKGIITSYPGQRNLEGKDENHAGVDIDADEGEPFVAADCGTVSFAGYKQSWGNLTIIDHGNGYETYYAHQSEIFVKEGDVVYKGQTIGLCGQTGRAFGSHMHFEMHLDGHIINPLTVMPPMFNGDNYDRWR